MTSRLIFTALLAVSACTAPAQQPSAQQPSETAPTAPLPTSPATKPADTAAAAPAAAQASPEVLPAETEPAELVKRAFKAPEGAVKLTKEGRLWVDKQGKQVILDGYVAMSRGMLEMFACPANTKEHESVVAVLARSRDVHTALLAIGAQSGTPVQYVPNFVSATGQSIRIWVLWYDKDGKLQKTDARKWVVHTGTKKPLQEDWVFAGSNFWKDPSDGQVYYEADSGDMICVSNFSSAMLDVPVLSSQDTGALQFSAAEGKVPPELTPVRLIMIPIPPPADNPPPRGDAVADPDKPPADKWLVRRTAADDAPPTSP